MDGIYIFQAGYLWAFVEYRFAADLIKTGDSLVEERDLNPLVPDQQVPQRLPVHGLVEGRLDQLRPSGVQRAVNGRAQGKVTGIGLSWEKENKLDVTTLFFFWHLHQGDISGPDLN